VLYVSDLNCCSQYYSTCPQTRQSLSEERRRHPEKETHCDPLGSSRGCRIIAGYARQTHQSSVEGRLRNIKKGNQCGLAGIYGRIKPVWSVGSIHVGVLGASVVLEKPRLIFQLPQGCMLESKHHFRPWRAITGCSLRSRRKIFPWSSLRSLGLLDSIHPWHKIRLGSPRGYTSIREGLSLFCHRTILTKYLG
jgi:hypothetical protein